MSRYAIMDAFTPAAEVVIRGRPGLSFPPGERERLIVSGALEQDTNEAGEVVEERLAIRPGPAESFGAYRFAGIPERQVHFLNRLVPALARLPLPEVPPDKMEAFERALGNLLGVLASERSTAGRIADAIELVEDMARLSG